MNNHIYNLIKSLTKKAQAMSKYDAYINDAEGCEECQALWAKLKKNDQEHLEEIKKVLEKHAKEGIL